MVSVSGLTLKHSGGRIEHDGVTFEGIEEELHHAQETYDENFEETLKAFDNPAEDIPRGIYYRVFLFRAH